MKKLFFLSAMIGLMASTATAIEIYSCNTVGVQRVSATANDKVDVPVPFVAIGGGDITLADALYCDNMSLADYAMISMNTSGKYNQWLWFGDLIAGGWYATTQNETTPPSANEQTLPRGTGVVVNHGNSKSNPIYVMGQYDPDTPMTSVVLKGNRSYLVNPTDTSFSIDAKFPFSTPFDLLDQIIIVRSGQTYTYLCSPSKKDGGWWYYRDAANKQVFDKPTIAPGEGFWYVRAPNALTNRTVVW